MSTNEKRNAIIIHGGGLVDPSKVVLLRIAKNLKESGAYDNIIIGKYSFESLYSHQTSALLHIHTLPELHRNKQLQRQANHVKVGFLHRDRKPDLVKKERYCLQYHPSTLLPYERQEA